MKSIKIFCVLLFIGVFSAVSAQKYQYSYISDRKFFSPDDLIGYTFLPSEKEYTDGDKDEINAGEVIFAITPQGVRISGGEYEGMYNAVSINSAKYGFIMKLMDARNPTEQGHIKFILDSKSNVDALVFKKNKDKPEVIFYQEQINDRTKKGDKKYFTDRKEMRVVNADSIWNQKILPFLRVSQREQDRIVPADSVYIEFVKEAIIKAVKEKPAEEVEKVEEVVEEKTLEGDEDFIMTDTGEETDTEEEIEDDEDDFIDEDDPLAGMLKKQRTKKKKKEKEKVKEDDEEEFIDVEEEELIDDDELAELEEEEAEEEARQKKEEKNKKKVKEPKVKYKHYIVLRFNRWEGTGAEATIKEERYEFPIKTWKMKTSPDPNDRDVRHLLEYSAKPNSILVFTDEDHNVSKVIIGNVEYLMRGY